MHSWDLTPKEAVALQRELAGRVEREDRLGLVSRVAGVDVSYHAASGRLAAAAVVLDAGTLQVMDVQIVLGHARLPISQLLKFGRGSVIELDKRIGEPVEVVINDRLVARGDLVKLGDARIGVSLTEIVKDYVSEN